LKRTAWILFFSLSATALPAIAEEISLKDGTKIVGHMTAITLDKIEVETSYGKVQLKRSDILTINFPENNTTVSTTSVDAKKEAPKVDEALNGLQYVNRTAKFTLTLAPDWMIDTEMQRAPATLAALRSKDKMRYLVVMQEEYPGSLESYKEIILLNSRKGLTNFEQVSESPATIDGKPALLVLYRGNLPNVSVPVAFLSALIQSGKNTYTKVTVWCMEPLFHDVEPVFEKMVNSYRSMNGQTTALSSRP
jgi:hypothetical protein